MFGSRDTNCIDITDSKPDIARDAKCINTTGSEEFLSRCEWCQRGVEFPPRVQPIRTQKVEQGTESEVGPGVMDVQDGDFLPVKSSHCDVFFLMYP